MPAITIGIVAGEASGDALAATLIEAVRARRPDVRFAGIAGPRMQAAGCDVLASQDRLAVRGLTEVVAHLPALIALRRQIARRLTALRVPVFVGVDAPDFNLGLERRLRRRRIRTVHFVSPSVWAWRRERLPKIHRAVDRMLALFPFEPALYEAHGTPVTFVGHPLAQERARPGTRAA
ncbi:MAG TPA: lipid-A-disaccharide synthase, partial [Casimicrobiaceae bacterium]|nr:lipid-A-disaccharide synthase [Casimicrobiaceae bacterium]